MKIHKVIVALLLSYFTHTIFAEYQQPKEIMILNKYRGDIVLHVDGQSDITLPKYKGKTTLKFYNSEQFANILKSIKIKLASNVVWHKGIAKEAAKAARCKYFVYITIEDTINFIHFEYTTTIH